MKIVRFLVVSVLAYLVNVVVWSALTWYDVIDPWLPTMPIRPTYFAVTFIAAIWMGLRVADRFWPSGDGATEPPVDEP